MRAVFFKGKDHPLVVQQIKKFKPVKDQVLVRLHNAAINHRDLWTWREQNLPASDGIILGSDGAGVIEDVGEDADTLLIGSEVIINPSLDWGTNPNSRLSPLMAWLSPKTRYIPSGIWIPFWRMNSTSNEASFL